MGIQSDRTLVMGILNVTPDSFSDGGKYSTVKSAVNHAKEMVEIGVDIIDIGGQSTRPGYTQISPEEELERLLPVLDALNGISVPISLDTFYPEVADECIKNGVSIINDVTGFSDSKMIDVAVKTGAECILMHNSDITQSKNTIEEINKFFEEKIAEMTDAGIDKEKICLDPGVGFGKTYEQNLQILGGYNHFKKFNLPLLAASSRKRVIGQPCGNPPFEDRLAGTIAAHTIAVLGGANIVRVHDVLEAVQAVRVTDAIMRS